MVFRMNTKAKLLLNSSHTAIGEETLVQDMNFKEYFSNLQHFTAFYRGGKTEYHVNNVVCLSTKVVIGCMLYSII